MEAANKALKLNCADLLCIVSTDRFVVAQYLGGAPQQCIHIHPVFHRYHLKHKQVAFLRDLCQGATHFYNRYPEDTSFQIFLL